MKLFIDTEFIESGHSRTIELLSIGIVSQDGHHLYAINADADLSHANDWVKANVLPHLNLGDGWDYRVSRDELAKQIRKFIGVDKPEFWGYYADYDWVVFCQIFGAMIDLPKGWPMYCRDIKQLCDERGNPTLPAQVSTEHNALQDARWNKIAYEFLVKTTH